MDDQPLVKAREAAQFLTIRTDTLYAGEAGTGHLQRLRLGTKTVRFYRPQLVAHRANIIKLGSCDGSCVKVFEEIEQPEPAGLKLVRGRK